MLYALQRSVRNSSEKLKAALCLRSTTTLKEKQHDLAENFFILYAHYLQQQPELTIEQAAWSFLNESDEKLQ